MFIQISTILLIMLCLVFIYRKYKRVNESLLILKLIGYYLLGSFCFNYNSTAIPAGFIIFLLFFWPRVNRGTKRAAAYLGLFAFICSLLVPALEKAYFERNREIAASSTNIYDINLEGDFEAIKQKLGIEHVAQIEDFQADFNVAGAIEDLRYTILTSDSEGFVLYPVNLNPNDKSYNVSAMRVTQWANSNNAIDEIRFFYALKQIDLKLSVSKDYPTYTIRCDGRYTGWAVKDWENFILTEKGFRKLKVEELPVKGFVFVTLGNKQTGLGSSEGDGYRAYIVP